MSQISTQGLEPIREDLISQESVNSVPAPLILKGLASLETYWEGIAICPNLSTRQLFRLSETSFCHKFHLTQNGSRGSLCSAALAPLKILTAKTYLPLLRKSIYLDSCIPNPRFTEIPSYFSGLTQTFSISRLSHDALLLLPPSLSSTL